MNKKICIRLPENHWVWSLPEGERSAIVRAALDFYAGHRQALEEILKNVLELKAKLDGPNERINEQIKEAAKVNVSGCERKRRLPKEKWLDF